MMKRENSCKVKLQSTALHIKHRHRIETNETATQEKKCELQESIKITKKCEQTEQPTEKKN